MAAVAASVDGFAQLALAGTTTCEATVTWSGGLRSHAHVRHMDPIVSDGPQALGGHDTAPNPVELLLAALGNCLAAGYVAHATAAGITVRSLEVVVSGRLDPSVVLGLRRGHAGFDSISAVATVDCDAEAAELQRLHDDVLASSPVGHTLLSSVPVTVEVTSGVPIPAT